jgi:hypothetical protein
MVNNSSAKPEPVPATSATQQEERRHWGRHAVSAVAQVVDVGSGSRLNTRASDLSLGGCYIDTMTPLPVGSEIRVGLLHESRVIELDATVIYAHPGLGMGVSFSGATTEQKAEISAWIAELAQEQDTPMTIEAMSNQQSASGVDRALIRKLIHLLIAKGILAEDEARNLLTKPLL